MSWYREAIFYHIYPLGLCAAPQFNSYTDAVNRLDSLYPWIDHIGGLGFNALYIGPLFESSSHGYDTTDYRKLDSRLGSNEDLKRFVEYCHSKGIRVILDAVFNHTGRDFFAFKDIRENRENSRYLYWYQNVNLYGNNSYGDGFSYDTWGGYDLLAKLDLHNQEVRDYHLERIAFWIKEFDIDGLRLDAANELDFEFMRQMRQMTSQMKEDFWLMGEVIHGEYERWVNAQMLHSVTDYKMYKAFYSAHNDHNYFEIAHTLKRQFDQLKDNAYGLYLFNDNHDVERIASRLLDLRNYYPLLVLLFTLPGIPSIYYGSEFAVEGKKERYSDASLRPHLNLDELKSKDPFWLKLIAALCQIRSTEKALCYGDYEQLQLTTGHYVFRRGDIIVAANNGNDAVYTEFDSDTSYTGALSGEKTHPENGIIRIVIESHSAEVYIPDKDERATYEPLEFEKGDVPEPEEKKDLSRVTIPDGPYDEMSVEELQALILKKLAANGPLNDRMIRDVEENVYHDSLVNWAKSFR